MGDGGLALGAGAWVNYAMHGTTDCALSDIYWGPAFSDEDVVQAVRKTAFNCRYCENPEQAAAQLIARGKIVFWCQGRMEYGPRALGNRSILALPGSQKIKDILNLQLKMRVWYQPFCPSMLQQEARRVLLDCNGCSNHFMTMGFMVREECRRDMEGVIGIDGSCRPQMVDALAPRFERLLLELKKQTGSGVVLNTSFNVHGEPLVCSPEDALRTMQATGNDCMFIGNHQIY
jgi:carbamoyltransferase